MIQIITARLLLRDFDRSDYSALREIESDPQVLIYRSRADISEAETRDFLDETIREAEEPHRIRYSLAVTRRDNARLVGQVGISLHGTWYDEARLFYSINRRYWGQGYASEAAAGLTHFAFETLGLRLVAASCHPDNIASWRVMEKIGMTRSNQRERLWVKESWWDMLIYEITREAWKQHAERFSA